MLATGVVPSLKLNATPLSGRLLDAVGAHGTNNVGGRCLQGFLYSKKTRQCKRKTQGCGSFLNLMRRNLIRLMVDAHRIRRGVKFPLIQAETIRPPLGPLYLISWNSRV